MLQIPPGQYRQVEREDNLAILRRERFAQIVLDEEDAQPANPISRSTPAVEPEGPATSSRVKESNLDDALVEVLPGQARGGIEGPTMAASNVNTPTTAHRTYQHNDLASAWRHDRAQESSHAPEARAQQLADCITSYCKGLRDLGKQVAGTKEIGARVNEDALKRLEAEVERRRVEVLRNDRINRQMEMRLTLDLMAARGKQFIGDLADLTKTQDDLRASMLKVSEDTLWLLNQLERVCGSFSELGLDVSSLNEAGEVKTLQREKTKAVTQALEEASM